MAEHTLVLGNKQSLEEALRLEDLVRQLRSVGDRFIVGKVKGHAGLVNSLVQRPAWTPGGGAPSGMPPQPPNGWGGPLTISAGGVYDAIAGINVPAGVGWQSSVAGTPSVRVATAQPVTIRGWVKHVDGGYGIFCNTSIPVQVTVEHVYAYGAPYPNWNSTLRWFNAENFKSVILRSCTIENTRGIELDTPVAASSVLIEKIKHLNCVGGNINTLGSGVLANFIQFRVCQNAAIEVRWCEVVNEYNKSDPEDIFSLYHTSNVWLHDCLLVGHSLPGNGSGSSQNTVTLDTFNGGPSPVNNNLIEGVQTVRTFSIALFPQFSPADNNVFLNNRCVNAGYLDDGVTRNFYGTGSSMHVISGGTNNHAHGNVLGAMTGQNNGARVRGVDGQFEGTVEGNGNGVNTGEWANGNVHLAPAGGEITRAHEDAEVAAWQQKLIANGIVVGA